MSGNPITHTYLERIEQADIRKILNQIADGYRISDIAPQIGVSRAFLSTHLHATALGRQCLAVAKEIAQRNRKHGHLSTWCAPVADKKREQLEGWLAAQLALPNMGAAKARTPDDHLAALQLLRAERAPEPQHQPTPATTLPYTPAPAQALPPLTTKPTASGVGTVVVWLCGYCRETAAILSGVSSPHKELPSAG